MINCRGIAFPQQFLNSQVPSIWECFAQYLTTQGQFISESEEGSAFANGDLCGVLRNGGANAKPLQDLPFTFLLFPCRRCIRLENPIYQAVLALPPDRLWQLTV